MKTPSVALFVTICAFAHWASAAVPVLDLPRLQHGRELRPTVDLAQGGVIVMPPEPRYQELAERLVVVLERSAYAKFGVVREMPAALAEGAVVVAVGNVMNNSVLRSLYWNLYTSVDPSFPGKDGYVIQTVQQPLPVFPKGNVVVLGGSTFEGAKAAVEAFAAELSRGKGSVLPPTLEVRGAAPADLGAAKGAGLRAFRIAVDNFRRTGNRRYVTDAVGILRRHRDETGANPDWVLVWGDEIDTWRAMQAWDLVQEFAGLPEAEVRAFDQMFIDLLPRLVERSEIFGTIKPGPVIGWNHTSIPLLGMYAIARHYETHYGLDLHAFREQPERYFEGQKANYRVSEDNYNYGEFSLQFVLAYYGLTDDWAYFDRGNAARMVRLLLAQVDNNGRAGGTGDAHDVEGPGSSFAWDMLDYRLSVPQLLWFKAQRADAESDYDRIWFSQRGAESRLVPRSRFHPELKPRRPDDLAGSVAVPLDRGLYDHLQQAGPFRMVNLAGLPKTKPTTPYAAAFDKLQFRSFSAAGGEYLLVDGFGQGDHGHLDTGAIVCGTFDGVRFLYDADYRVAKSSDHSMVTILRNGEATLPVPPLAALEANVNFSDGAYAQVSVANYNGGRWRRHLLWFKDRCTLVFDTVEAEQAGTFQLDCAWKVLDRGSETFDGRNLTCRATAEATDQPATKAATRTFHLRSVDAGRWLQRRPDSNAATHIVHQRRTVALKPGEMRSFQNVFYLERPDASGRVAQYTPQRLSENAALIAEGENRWLALVGPADGALTTDGQFVVLGAEELMAVGTSRVVLNGRTLFFATNKVSLRSQADGLEIVADEAGSYELAVGAELQRGHYAKGTTRVKLGSPMRFAGVAEHLSTLSTPTQPAEPVAVPAADWKPRWSQSGWARGARHPDVCVGDLDGDGRNETLVAAGKALVYYDAAGRQVWRYADAEELTSCQIMPAGNGPVRVLAGTMDARLLGFTAQGALVKTVEVMAKQAGQYGMRANPWITHLRVLDLDGDGRPEVMAGLRNWQLQVLNADLTPRWYNAMVLHGTSDIQVGKPMDGRRLLYVGDRYGGSHVFDVDRSPRDELQRVAFNAMADVALAIADLNGDGVEEIISASDEGRVTAFDRTRPVPHPLYRYDAPEATTLWRYNNYAFAFSAVVLVDAANGSGERERAEGPGESSGRSFVGGALRPDMKPAAEPTLVAASESGHLYYLNARTGALLKTLDLGDGITTLEHLGDGVLAAGSESGRVYLIDAAGTVRHRAAAGGRVVKLLSNGADLIALDETGAVTVLDAADAGRR